jgi:hypothetical protein
VEFGALDSGLDDKSSSFTNDPLFAVARLGSLDDVLNPANFLLSSSSLPVVGLSSEEAEAEDEEEVSEDEVRAVLMLLLAAFWLPPDTSDLSERSDDCLPSSSCGEDEGALRIGRCVEVVVLLFVVVVLLPFAVDAS